MKSKLIQKTDNSMAKPTAPLDQLRVLMTRSDRVLVVSHVDPDGDALGTQLAFAGYLKSLGKTVFLVRDGEIPPKYLSLPGIDSIKSIDSLGTIPDKPAIDTMVALECPTIERAGKAIKFIDDTVTIVNIDHHRENSQFGILNWVDEKASSVGEMVYEYFEHIDYEIDPDSAVQLYAAILTDTGRFRYRSTSPRTMEIGGKLLALGVDPQKVCDSIYFEMPVSTLTLTGKVLNEIEFHHNDAICLLTLKQKHLSESKAEPAEAEGLVDYTMRGKGVIVGALLKEIDDQKTRVSLRSRDGINVAALAARFDGGGHFNAAGCTVPLPLKEAHAKILSILIEAIGTDHA